MWISEGLLEFLKILAFLIAILIAIEFAVFLSELIVNLIEQTIGEARFRILELLIKAAIAILITYVVGSVAILGLRELFHQSNIWITLIIAISWAIVPVLWIISKIRQIKGDGRSYDL